MKAIARTFYKIPVVIRFILAVPLFYFLFVLAYDPFDLSEFLAAGRGLFTLYLIVSTLIILGVMLLSRLLLFLLRRVLDLNWPLYILWCVGEVTACALFMSIPMGICWAGEFTYFYTLGRCFLYLALILVFPMALITMGVQIHVLEKQAALAPTVDERSLIRFYDEQQRVKLIVASDAVLYIECEENYVHIYHLDNGRVREFVLRSSMRALEEVLGRHGLVRCHRSFFVNPAHVDLVRRDSNGYVVAQLDREGLRSVPVSKRYYEALTALL